MHPFYETLLGNLLHEMLISKTNKIEPKDTDIIPEYKVIKYEQETNKQLMEMIQK